MYIAHIRNADGEEQLLKNHLRQSADLSGNWGKKLGLEKTCYLAGLLHDLGKFSDEFQTYLRQAVIDPSSVTRGSVDHSTAGGKLLYDYCHKEQYGPFSLILAELVGNAIISHHSSRGLQDFFSPEGEAKSDYLVRVAEKEIEEYDQIRKRFFEEVISEAAFQRVIELAKAELSTLYSTDGKVSMKPNTTFFLLKFVYSCLLDADRTNTMLFETNQKQSAY
jgi:CRISPR-associated endonuclease/helicase Cas3